MKSNWKAGLAIGVLCAVWEIIMAATGWITSPDLMNLFYLVILIQVGVMVWGLKLRAAERSYGRQVLDGTCMSVIAGAFLFAFSLLLTTVLFPDLIDRMKAVQMQSLKNAGRSEVEISQRLALQTPLIQALMGFAGTVLTGVLASLVIAVFARRKDRPPEVLAP